MAAFFNTLSALLVLILLHVLVPGLYGEDPDTTRYVMLSPASPDPLVPEVARCIARNRCLNLKLVCPYECPKRSSTKPGASACFIDCSSAKCETTCRHRNPNCYGYGSVCYDPRFVGGDGLMFYFHGHAGADFCLVSDRNLQINAHFIGKRPEGRTRDYTWVQALGIMYDDHKFSVAAKKVAKWDDKVEQLVLTYDGQEVYLPQTVSSTWASSEEEIRVERLAETNSVQITIDGVMSLSVDVVPITQHEDKVHNYQIPEDDCFAHLNMQFKFYGLSASVEGVLGKTYQPNYISPLKTGVPMPIMGGEDMYRVSSLFATDCKANKFSPSSLAPLELLREVQNAKCSSTVTAGGIVCRR